MRIIELTMKEMAPIKKGTVRFEALKAAVVERPMLTDTVVHREVLPKRRLGAAVVESTVTHVQGMDLAIRDPPVGEIALDRAQATKHLATGEPSRHVLVDKVVISGRHARNRPINLLYGGRCPPNAAFHEGTNPIP